MPKSSSVCDGREKLAPRIFLKLAVLPRKDSCCRIHERLISHVRAVCENSAAVHKTCPGSPLLAWIHILSFFFFSPRLPLVAASHTHLLPFLCPLSPQSAISPYKTGALGLATTPRKSGFLLSACRRRALCGTTLATILHLRSHRREAMSTGVSTRRRAA